LHFQIRNNHTGSKSEKEYSGIGIENSKKRLDLIYGDQYTLEIEDKKDEFIVNLNIPV
jgi:sensor histidine kinase YesM